MIIDLLLHIWSTRSTHTFPWRTRTRGHFSSYNRLRTPNASEPFAWRRPSALWSGPGRRPDTRARSESVNDWTRIGQMKCADDKFIVSVRHSPCKSDTVEIQKWSAVRSTCWSTLSCNTDSGTRVRRWAENMIMYLCLTLSVDLFSHFY